MWVGGKSVHKPQLERQSERKPPLTETHFAPYLWTIENAKYSTF